MSTDIPTFVHCRGCGEEVVGDEAALTFLAEHNCPWPDSDEEDDS